MRASDLNLRSYQKCLDDSRVQKAQSEQKARDGGILTRGLHSSLNQRTVGKFHFQNKIRGVLMVGVVKSSDLMSNQRHSDDGQVNRGPGLTKLIFVFFNFPLDCKSRKS